MMIFGNIIVTDRSKYNALADTKKTIYHLISSIIIQEQHQKNKTTIVDITQVAMI